MVYGVRVIRPITITWYKAAVPVISAGYLLNPAFPGYFPVLLVTHICMLVITGLCDLRAAETGRDSAG
jgi:hypothetical protein